MSKYTDNFQAECFYHIFNRAISSEELFRNEENANFFFSKINKYLLPFFDFYAYCLLPNHFHFVLKTKSIAEINEYYISIQDSKIINSENFHEVCMRQISKLIISYSKSYNKYYNRKGSLFIEKIKRVQLKSEQDIIAAIFYVHKNPVHHGYTDKLDNWTNSSYRSIKHILEDEFVNIPRVVELFGGMENFDQVHKQFLYK